VAGLALPEGVDPAALTAALSELSADAGIDLGAVHAAMARGQTLVQALGLPPQVVDLLYAQAFAAHDAGRILAALQMFQALTMLAPRVRDHWLGLAVCLRRLDQGQAAGLALDTALALDPDSPATRLHRLDLACHRGDWSAARAELAALDRLPDTPARRVLGPEVQRLRTLVTLRAG